MKKFYSIISLSLISLSLVYGQEAEDILGLWANEDSTQIVQVMKQGNVFVGKLTNLKGDNSGSLLDFENPEIGKKSSTLIGLDVWIDFVYNEARHNWVDGKIYNYSNLGSTNWSDFAKKIIEYSKLKCQIREVSSLSFKLSLTLCLINLEYNLDIISLVTSSLFSNS